MRSIPAMVNTEWCTKASFKVVMATIKRITTVTNSRCRVQTIITRVMARPFSPLHPAVGFMEADMAIAKL